MMALIEQTSGATGTTYDQLAATMPGETVKIPVAWYCDHVANQWHESSDESDLANE